MAERTSFTITKLYMMDDMEKAWYYGERMAYYDEFAVWAWVARVTYTDNQGVTRTRKCAGTIPVSDALVEDIGDGLGKLLREMIGQHIDVLVKAEDNNGESEAGRY